MNDAMDTHSNELCLIKIDRPRYSPSRLRWLTGLGIMGLLAIFATSDIASAQVTSASATTLKAVKVARGPDATEINSTAWEPLPGTSLSFTVPVGVTSVFITRFTAESACYGTNLGWCSVRVLVHGSEANPVVGTDFAFDSDDAGTASSDGWKGHAVDRSLSVTNTGTAPLPITVSVQYTVTDPTIEFRLDDWHFTVEQFQ